MRSAAAARPGLRRLSRLVISAGRHGRVPAVRETSRSSRASFAACSPVAPSAASPPAAAHSQPAAARRSAAPRPRRALRRTGPRSASSARSNTKRRVASQPPQAVLTGLEVRPGDMRCRRRAAPPPRSARIEPAAQGSSPPPLTTSSPCVITGRGADQGHRVYWQPCRCVSPRGTRGGPWRAERLTVIAATLMRPGYDESADHLPSSWPWTGAAPAADHAGGAAQDAVPGSAVVHTDDIAWWPPGSAGPTC